MNYIYIGKFEGTHGLKGEIKFQTDFKYLDRVFIKDFSFFLGDCKDKLQLNSYRPFKNGYLVSFQRLDNIDLIKKYINQKVYILKEDLKLNENEYVLEDFLNKEAIYQDKYLGKIIKITNEGLNNYIIYIRNEKEILIPLNKHFVDRITTDKIYFKNVEGLIDEN